MSSNDFFILGIYDGHNTGACLLKNGLITYAISEERLTREKNDVGFPYKAIKKILELSKINSEDINLVALASRYTHRREFYSNWNWYKVGYNEQVSDGSDLALKEKKVLDRLVERKKDVTKFLNIEEKKIVVVDHHTAHAASAYHVCPWNKEDVLVFTNDGSGDGICATVSLGQDGKLSRISQTENSASLGKIYSRIALLLGMKPWEHEYKIMGLAPYADEQGVSKSYQVLNRLIEVKNGSLNFNMKSNLSTHYCYQFLKNELENHRFDWIAGAIQKLTEDLLVNWVKNAIKKTGIHKIACAGGVFMNVKANMKIMEMDDVEDIFVFPSCGDESLAIGAAYSVYADHINSIGEKYSQKPLGDIFFGPEFSNEEIETKIQNNLDDNYSIEKIDDMSKYIAENLANGEIVARFDGRMEFGQRSLGNRSILADPSNYETIREINMAIKQRDFWMPFAPSILYEKQHEIIFNPKEIKSPYMIMAFRTKENIRKKLTASIHPYDFTARPQILEKSFNPKYYNLLTKFYKITNIPGILNTSFNLHGEPIVCSPIDAIQTFIHSKLKNLAIGNYYIKKIT